MVKIRYEELEPIITIEVNVHTYDILFRLYNVLWLHRTSNKRRLSMILPISFNIESGISHSSV